MNPPVSLDFETYSECDLKSCGAWIYAGHPTTEVLCMGYAFGDEPPRLWLPGDPLPPFATDPRSFELRAWNSMFEWVIWHLCLKWAAAPVENWTDTMALAAAMALPLSLDACGQAVGLDKKHLKSKRGKYLIQRLCKPFRGSRCTDPELLAELYDYCRQDVVAEREIGKGLKNLSATERRVWELDQQINLRGAYLDRRAALDVIRGVEARNEKQIERFAQLTDGAVSGPRSYVALKEWVNQQTGLELESVNKAVSGELLAEGNLPAHVHDVLQIKSELSKSSVAKFKAAVGRTTGEDRRARGLFQYHGASTGRWSGRGIQLQNLPRNSYDEDLYAQAALCFEEQSFDWMDFLLGHPFDVASQMIRGMICAPPGYELLCADFAAIEGRGLAYLAGEEWVLDEYRAGKDMYKVTAAIALGKKYEEIEKHERNQLGKPGELGCGYGGGPQAIRNVGGGKGMTDDEIYEKIVTPWRKARPKIVNYWYDIERAAMSAVRHPGEIQVCRTIKFVYKRPFLRLRLPSGRVLYYAQPKIEPVETPWGEMKDSITFYGMKIVDGKTTSQWAKVVTRGAKLVENITQAFCRDLLAEAMLRLDDAGYKIVVHVHDEIVAEEKTGTRDLKEFEAIMAEVPQWAEGMPIEVEGWRGQRYRK